MVGHRLELHWKLQELDDSSGLDRVSTQDFGWDSQAALYCKD